MLSVDAYGFNELWRERLGANESADARASALIKCCYLVFAQGLCNS